MEEENAIQEYKIITYLHASGSLIFMSEGVGIMVPKKELSLLLLNNLRAALSVSDLVYILRARTAVLWAKLCLNIITWRLVNMFYLSASSLVW